MTGREKIVGLGPRRGEASLSSTALSLRKTLHRGSVPRVPSPRVQRKGAAFLDPVSAPHRSSVFIAALLPTPSLVFPRQPASPGHLHPKVL